MSNGLAEVQARQTVQKMRLLKNDVVRFSEQAKLLSRTSQHIDSLFLMQEANILLNKLMAARLDFQQANARVNSLKHSLPSAMPRGGGMSPAALWGNEMRAASKQFTEAVGHAENSLRQLYKISETGLNSPTRTSTGDPSGAFDILMAFIELMGRIIEHSRSKPQ